MLELSLPNYCPIYPINSSRSSLDEESTECDGCQTSDSLADLKKWSVMTSKVEGERHTDATLAPESGVAEAD